MLKTQSLLTEVVHVIRDKGTELPFSGEYEDWDRPGTYLCRQCGLALFRSQSKFHSACGWPSFDEEIAGAVKKQVDNDGLRMEILCARCNGHLGHIFNGEGFTAKDTRYCVNSVSLDFVEDLKVIDAEEAIFAGGCFWGIEYYFKRLNGVLKTEVGFIGGHNQQVSYEQVCAGDTGHFEATRVIYDPKVIDYEKLAKYFFEIHDPTQTNGQGPDIGEQYLSVVFYYDENQKRIAQQLIATLKQNGYQVATRLIPVTPFRRAAQYHQDYYDKNHKTPYCHKYMPRFG